ncbi:DegT/DnrJ/EryC1/StrS family aminotransferase [Candidatus Woesearchaeota archaeon]|nr:DegT/DnrJ/EryC1/StrS family aminotransferase [Candidatus Woesearchaeota archaeon]
MKIPLCKASIGKEEKALVLEVLESGWLAHGPKGKEFQDLFSKYVGVKHALALNSCTSALQVALQAKGITGEVIVPSFTFVASANAVVTAGAKPVFADIDYETGNIDPASIKKYITPKTQAIMPVHYAGLPCKMDEIMEIAEEHSLLVVEDSAECLGGEFQKKRTGSFGVGCFSFYPTKNITTGEGGMLTTNDEDIVRQVEMLRAHGIPSSTFAREKLKMPWQRAAEVAGYNFRLSDVLAALGVVQMKKIDSLNEKRREHAAYLTKSFSSLSGIETPVEPSGTKHVYQMYVVKLEGDRDKFISYLREKGIGTSVHFDPPVHMQPYYKEFAKPGSLPLTEKITQSIVTLPMFPDLTQEELDYMIEHVEQALKVS